MQITIIPKPKSSECSGKNPLLFNHLSNGEGEKFSLSPKKIPKAHSRVDLEPWSCLHQTLGKQIQKSTSEDGRHPQVFTTGWLDGDRQSPKDPGWGCCWDPFQMA